MGIGFASSEPATDLTTLVLLSKDVFMDQLQPIGVQVPWMLTNGGYCHVTLDAERCQLCSTA